MSELAVLLAVLGAVIVVGLLLAPETWMLLSMIADRGGRGVRVRLRDGPVRQTALARRDFDDHGDVRRGQVFVDGEVWAAECAEPGAEIRAGDPLRVTGRRGLTLQVEPEDGG